ncbi:hypothetical protein [Varunaivibrio sulfuroxidans]|uniref:Uncharacterized protein n=1 Tax=Varunaivibrio sulfuroxidans TaxID=1773489 RepID=A0A4R3JF47_9PROT|nr:hypothetical protein [Varunaivibrio sulfuroxidans]TCS64105.1 hypothetical protein EDD55_102144 [Varunaivibrio sulfuroxidans]WES31446.1 hypothetical protein P3M64_03490 [Varunaivibrio sulfuroxidans]
MIKSLRERAELTAQDIQKILGISAEDHPKEIADAIEVCVVKALLEERERCAMIAFDHVCPEDRDKAHKLSDEIKKVKNALMTNLSSLR